MKRPIFSVAILTFICIATISGCLNELDESAVADSRLGRLRPKFNTPRKAEFSDEDLCGNYGRRIYGGKPANLGEFPWLAQIYVMHEGASLFNCGGTLIAKKWILTAAHCIKGFTGFTIRLGSVDRSQKGTTYEQVFEVAETFFHPEYIDDPVYFFEYANNDIGLIKLTKAVQYTDSVQPLCLPDAQYCDGSSDDVSTTDEYDSCRNKRDGLALAGWGKYIDKMGPAEVLQKINMTLLNRKNCETAYPGIICSRGVNQGQSTCQGDSGGPLVCYKNHRAYQIGVVSSSWECGKSPTRFSRVCSFTKWIRDVMAAN